MPVEAKRKCRHAAPRLSKRNVDAAIGAPLNVYPVKFKTVKAKRISLGPLVFYLTGVREYSSCFSPMYRDFRFAPTIINIQLKIDNPNASL
jgi:hypothetical protein